MVEIHVEGVDATVAHALVLRLAGLFDRSSVSFDRARNEVRVCSEWDARAVVQVIETVEAWQASYGVGSARLSIGDRSYTMIGPAIAGGLAG